MTRTVQLLRHDTYVTIQLQVHDVCNCTIMAQIRAADDQSDLRILI